MNGYVAFTLIVIFLFPPTSSRLHFSCEKVFVHVDMLYFHMRGAKKPKFAEMKDFVLYLMMILCFVLVGAFLNKRHKFVYIIMQFMFKFKKKEQGQRIAI